MPLTLRGDGTVSGATFTPTGVVLPYAGITEPTGWLFCYGQAVSRTTYSDLFTALGTTYGAGDGSTTFNLPDMRGRVAAGRDNMGGSAASRLTTTVLDKTSEGGVGGAQTHTLTEAQLASHNHIQDQHRHGPGTYQSTYPSSSIGESAGMYHRTNAGDIARGDNTNNNGAWVSNLVASGTSAYTTPTNQPTGGGAAHNNTQPTIVLNYIIKAA